MKAELLAKVVECLDQGGPGVFCSVLETRGSTPQEAGASMLVLPDGRQAGTLGGGCVEAEVRQRALGMGAGAGAAVHSFSLDQDYGWDDGLICGGQMRILTLPLEATRDAGYFRRFHDLVAAGKGCTEAIVLDASAWPGLAVGTRFLFDAAGGLVDRLGAGEPPAEVLAALKPPATRPRPAVLRGISVLPVLPRCRLVIVGGGHVGEAVGRLASQMDFDVWVLDDRDAFANAERFPTAARILVADIGETCRTFEADPSDYFVVVTRGHKHDEEAAYHLATKPGRYLGLIGSRRKIKLIFDDLEAQGIDRAILSRIHAPLGLDIAAVTVPEIAVSIVAELVSHRNHGVAPGSRTPGSLSAKWSIS